VPERQVRQQAEVNKYNQQSTERLILFEVWMDESVFFLFLGGGCVQVLLSLLVG